MLWQLAIRAKAKARQNVLNVTEKVHIVIGNQPQINVVCATDQVSSNVRCAMEQGKSNSRGDKTANELYPFDSNRRAIEKLRPPVKTQNKRIIPNFHSVA